MNMSRAQSSNANNQNLTLNNDKEKISLSNRSNSDKHNQSLIKNINKMTNWSDRIKNYFMTNEGRIALVSLFFTLLCVIIQHIMGTCDHSISDGTTAIKWYIFTPPFGAGPHTAAYFFVLSWIVLIYCIEQLWTNLVTDIIQSKEHSLIVHGVIVLLFFTAFGFNIWGYVLCESSSQINASRHFVPGVCRGDSQACIPLIAGVLTSFATACAFLSEHIIAFMTLLKKREESNGSTSNRILL